jgi:hypothetical protein
MLNRSTRRCVGRQDLAEVTLLNEMAFPPRPDKAAVDRWLSHHRAACCARLAMFDGVKEGARPYIHEAAPLLIVGGVETETARRSLHS